MSDCIRVVDLEVWTRLGITAEERAAPQRVLISLELTHDLARAAATDDLAETIDYAAVAESARARSESGERRLLEALAGDLAQAVLAQTTARAVRVEIKKFVVPGTAYTSVVLHREATTL